MIYISRRLFVAHRLLSELTTSSPSPSKDSKSNDDSSSCSGSWERSIVHELYIPRPATRLQWFSSRRIGLQFSDAMSIINLSTFSVTTPIKPLSSTRSAALKPPRVHLRRVGGRYVLLANGGELQIRDSKTLGQATQFDQMTTTNRQDSPQSFGSRDSINSSSNFSSNLSPNGPDHVMRRHNSIESNRWSSSLSSPPSTHERSCSHHDDDKHKESDRNREGMDYISWPVWPAAPQDVQVELNEKTREMRV